MKLTNMYKILGTTVVMGQLLAGPIISHADTNQTAVQTKKQEMMKVTNFNSDVGKEKLGWYTDEKGRKFYYATGNDGILVPKGKMALGFQTIDGKTRFFKFEEHNVFKMSGEPVELEEGQLVEKSGDYFLADERIVFHIENGTVTYKIENGE
ncbi:hypothetical protein BK708_37550 [Bacillus thuringiensis serovar yunnanensis]|nr:hypothetical protein BK708_37550 [Bacillus thuringiensis serovar yunnanensis]